MTASAREAGKVHFLYPRMRLRNICRTQLKSSGGFSGGLCRSTHICSLYVPIFRQKVQTAKSAQSI